MGSHIVKHVACALNTKLNCQHSRGLSDAACRVRPERSAAQQATPRHPSRPRQQALQAPAAHSPVLQSQQYAAPRLVQGRVLAPCQRTPQTTVAGRLLPRSRQSTTQMRLQGARARQRSRRSRRVAAARSTARVLRVTRSSIQIQSSRLAKRYALPSSFSQHGLIT